MGASGCVGWNVFSLRLPCGGQPFPLGTHRLPWFKQAMWA